MTSTGTVTAAVAQALFRVTEDGRTSVVASSLDGTQAEHAWLSWVEPHLGFPVAPDSAAPVHALSYLAFPDGFVAVLRRTREPRRPGCVDTHALLGSADVLTPAAALSTSDWAGWRDDPPADRRLPSLRADELRVPDAPARLRARALAQGDLLARSLAWLLQSPQAPIGLLGCPDEDRIALVWALWEIAAPELPQRSWTFATHPDAAPHDQPAAITFFPAPPGQHAAADRIVVDLHRGHGASPQNEYHANALVYRYEYGVDPPTADNAPGVLPVPAPVPTSAPAPAYGAASAYGVQPEPLLGVPAGSARPPWQWDALVKDAARARDPHALNNALVELEYAVAGVDDREDVRKALESAGWAIAAIRRHVPFSLRDAVFDRVVRVAFGATGPGRVTPGARADARRLAESSDSVELVRALARAGMETDLADVLARRWLLEHEPVRPDPMAGLGPVGRFLRRCGLPVTPAGLRRALLLTTLLVGLVLGVVLDGVFR